MEVVILEPAANPEESTQKIIVTIIQSHAASGGDQDMTDFNPISKGDGPGYISRGGSGNSRRMLALSLLVLRFHMPCRMSLRLRALKVVVLCME